MIIYSVHFYIVYTRVFSFMRRILFLLQVLLTGINFIAYVGYGFKPFSLIVAADTRGFNNVMTSHFQIVFDNDTKSDI